MSIPYIGFGNEQLKAAPRLKAGDEIVCPHCHGMHAVEDSTPPLLLSYKCGDKAYMAGIDGRNTMGLTVACSGVLSDGALREGK